MPDAGLIIGGLTVLLTGGDSLARLLAVPGMGVFRTAAPANPDMVLHLDADLPEADGSMLHRFSYDGDTKECQLLADGDDGWRYTFSTGGSLRIDGGNTASCSALADQSTLRFAAWLAYSMLATRLGRVAVHSSTVVCRGRAVMCLGESGTGKSTHTHLWQKHIAGATLLNDDSPIVAVTADGGVEVYGSPWSGKEPCFRQEHYPLAALIRIVQRPENSISRLSTIEAFTALQPSCPPSMMYDERLLDRVVPIISNIISRVPVYRLGCLPDADAAHLSYSTVYGS